MNICTNARESDDICLNGGYCSSNSSCSCPNPCFVGVRCEINNNAVRFPLSGAVLQEEVSARSVYIAFFLILFICGSINNILSLLVFLREKIRSTVLSIYLIFFSFFSLILSIVVLSYTLTIPRFYDENYRIAGCHGFPFIGVVMVDGSILCTSALAIERVLIESFNFPIVGSRIRPMIISILIFIYSSASNIDEIFLRRLALNEQNEWVCVYDFDGYPTWRQIDIIFSYLHVILPWTTHFLCTLITLTTIARRKIFVGLTNKPIYKVWLEQLYQHRDLLIPQISLLVCILPHGIFGHLLRICVPLTDRLRLRLHIVFIILLYCPQMFTFLLYVFPKDLYLNEFRHSFVYKIFSQMRICGRRKNLTNTLIMDSR